MNDSDLGMILLSSHHVGHLAMSGDFLLSQPRRGAALASSVWRAKMLVNILPCARQPPTTQNHLAPHVSNAEAEKLWATKRHDSLKMFLKPVKFHVNQGTLHLNSKLHLSEYG